MFAPGYSFVYVCTAKMYYFLQFVRYISSERALSYTSTSGTLTSLTPTFLEVWLTPTHCTCTCTYRIAGIIFRDIHFRGNAFRKVFADFNFREIAAFLQHACMHAILNLRL